MTKKMNLEHRVRFAGFVANEEPQAQPTADVDQVFVTIYFTSGGEGSTRRRAVYVAKNNPDN